MRSTFAGRLKPLERLRTVALATVAAFGFVEAASGSRSSTIAMNPDGSLLAVANTDSGSVSIVALPDQAVLGEIAVGREPQNVSFSTNGLYALVSLRLDHSVSVIDLASLEVAATIPVPGEPIGLVATQPGMVYVACQDAGGIAIIDLAEQRVVDFIATPEAPRGLQLSSDQTTLYVSHFFTGALTAIDIPGRTVLAHVRPNPDGNLANGIALDPERRRVYLPITRSDVTNPNLFFDATVFPVVSVLDLETFSPVPAERINLDIADEPVNMPFDAVLLGEHQLYVLNAGSNDISVINTQDKMAEAHIEVGDHPRGMTLSEDQETLYVNNSLAGTVSVIDTASQSVTGEFSVTRLPLADNVLNGKRLFYTTDRTDMARDQWISCGTCHFEGEMDRRTWFFPDGPRNTTSLLGVVQTLPLHWSGNLDELQDVESTIRDIQAGTGLADGTDHCMPACDTAPPNAGRSADLDDLAAFMASLALSRGPSTPTSIEGAEALRRGEALFNSQETGCVNCHIPPLFIDRLRHDVGTAAEHGEFQGPEFDTPSLRGVRKTAPFLHDGSAPSLRSVITIKNPNDRHGRTAHLDDNEVTELVSYLESLEGEPGFLIGPTISGQWLSSMSGHTDIFIGVTPDDQQIFLHWLSQSLFAHGRYEGNRATLSTARYERPDQQYVLTLSPETSASVVELEFSDCATGLVTLTHASAPVIKSAIFRPPETLGNPCTGAP